MGQTVSIYLTDGALADLEALVEQRKQVFGDGANPSNTLCDLITTQGPHYAEVLRHIQATVAKYTTGKFARNPTDEVDACVGCPLVTTCEVENRQLCDYDGGPKR